jgi:uncharacterized protein YbcC (UPF0753/DUF2309 family)
MQAAAQPARLARLVAVLEHAARLLPAQGPIGRFVHHNTLHAFEALQFDEAVLAAARVHGAEPFLREEAFRELLAQGRILARDLSEELRLDLGDSCTTNVGLGLDRLSLRTLALLALEEELDPQALAWRVSDMSGRDAELWAACRAAMGNVQLPDPPSRRLPSMRLRDLLVAAGAADPDDLVSPLVGRVVGAFVDQGVAYWSLPGLDEGLFAAARDLLSQRLDSPEPWRKGLARTFRRLARSRRTAAQVAIDCLDELGVEEFEWDELLSATLLALPGWAGIIRQLELRPDRAPVHSPPTRLIDFVALRLVLDLHAARFVAGEAGFDTTSMAQLRRSLEPLSGPSHDVEASLRASLALFQIAKHAGFQVSRILRIESAEAQAIARELEAFDDLRRRRVWHLAYERRHLVEVVDGLAAHLADADADAGGTTSAALVFCIDERMESLRRHVEETTPSVRTFGIAGFFGVAMYYRGLDDAVSAPLCPIALVPEHEVNEVPVTGQSRRVQLRSVQRRMAGQLAHGANVGSRTFVRGTLWSSALGVASAIPLVARVLVPRLAARFGRAVGSATLPQVQTRLALLRASQGRLPSGRAEGFDVAEMVAIVKAVLEEIGLTQGFPRLVGIIGHGSSSLNNPHESAHDCGACGGGRGGPNARAFAQMANSKAVREQLASGGVNVPVDTCFFGAYYDTCNCSLTLYDRDQVPESHRDELDSLLETLDAARAQDAHERCRRFDNAPLDLSPSAALRHVEARAEDLAQTRPEYGHATNAVCIIGRRSRTRGLYLDRRAFLVSYDPTSDPSGTILGRILAAAGPVCAGINLEYYFSFVDPVRYGCATKLPHNITGLMGVMDGHASDLRTGLPWQMVEIHEPVRLLFIIERNPESLSRVISESPVMRRLVENAWVRMAALDPDSAALWVRTSAGFQPYEPRSSELPHKRSSLEWYRGHREHLPPARIGGSPA